MMLHRTGAAATLGLIVGLTGTAWHADALSGQGNYSLGDLGGRAAFVDGQPRHLRIVAVHPVTRFRATRAALRPRSSSMSRRSTSPPPSSWPAGGFTWATWSPQRKA